jgi:hypothetical protein
MRGVQTLRALNQLKVHVLSGFERFIAIHFDRRIVGKEIIAAFFGQDETVPFGVVEPLYFTPGSFTFRHGNPPSQAA